MSTAPWASTAPELITASHGQVMRAVATHPDFDAPIPLTVEDWSVSFDERRAPRVSANLTVALDDLDLMTRLDPRTGVRVELEAGYVQAGGTEDVQQLADLGLRTIVPDLADRTMRLDCAGDEALVIDASPAVVSSVSAASHSAAALAIIKQAISPAPKFVATITGGAAAIDPIPDRWAAVQDLADRLDAKVYDDGLRVWHFDPSPTVAGTPILTLRVGVGGTILRAQPAVDREAWHNYVAIRYRWRDAADVDHQIIGTAYINAGPYAITGPAGKRILLDDREVATTQAGANAAAAAVLMRQLSRSHTFQLNALSAYWLRPGHTIDVRLTPDAPPGLQLVQAVTFRSDGTMDLDTRIPDPRYLPTVTAPATTTPPAAPAEPDPVPPAVETYVSTWTANADRTFKQGGAQNTVAAPDVIQGYFDATNGNQTGVILFTASNSTGDESSVSITTALSGATVSKVEVWLFANHWYKGTGGAARLGYFAGTSLPATYTGAKPYVSASSWKRDTGRWVNITSAALIAALKAGTARGVTVGPGVGADRTFYGKFNGAGASSSKPLLRITYSK